ncbi:hypothetical protein [Herpetosiphon sp. NSE202]|uniref:hypothetical protein n=1 Tax=Herpetosiphon sp. NSE202 TaxID=3351349 RepID=UPI003634F0E7
MDTIEFIHLQPSDEIEIIINGIPLLTHVANIEQHSLDPQDPYQKAGDHINIQTYYFAQLNPQRGYLVCYDQLPLLRCCNICDNPSIISHMTVTAELVIWHTFDRCFNNYRPYPWAYNGLGPFIFDRQQYTRAWQQAAQAIFSNVIGSDLFYDGGYYGWALRIKDNHAALLSAGQTISLNYANTTGEFRSVDRYQEHRWRLDCMREHAYLVCEGTSHYERIIFAHDSTIFTQWFGAKLDDYVQLWQNPRLHTKLFNAYRWDVAQAYIITLPIALTVLVPQQSYQVVEAIDLTIERYQRLLQ